MINVNETQQNSMMVGTDVNKLIIQRRVLKALYFNGPLSIPELSKEINRTVPTTTQIINELVKDDLINEQGFGDSSGGRKPILFGIIPNSGYIAAIKINHKNYHITIYNLANQVILEPTEYPLTNENDPEFIVDIYRNLQKKLESLRIRYDRILAIGISLLGLIDSQRGISYTYYKFGDKPLINYFNEQFKKPVYIENDSRLLTLGEHRFGTARNTNNILLVNYNTGIGLGMIFNGQIYSGNSGFAGELGHIQVKPEGNLCYCGKQGCLETVASGNTVYMHVKNALENGTSSQINQILENQNKELNLDIIITAALKGDQLAINAIEVAADELGRALASMVHILNPEMIIIGGVLARAGKFVLNPIRHAIDKYTLEKASDDLQVELSELGDKAIYLGVMTMVVERIWE